MNQSFLLTNMCPQDGSLNGGAWQKLEDKCRTWAIQFSDIYIVSGPIYSGGKVSRTMRFPLSGRARDFHPLDYAHVGRTMQKA